MLITNNSIALFILCILLVWMAWASWTGFWWAMDWLGAWSQARRRLAPYHKVNDCKPGCFMIREDLE